MNCSNEQTYLTNQELYIQASAIDLFNQLKLNPDSSIGASIYEKTPYDPLASNRSTNRFLYELIQTPSVPQVYYGSSGQELFKISFETFNGVTQGEYFKVVLFQRINAPNRVTDFIIDYYKTLKMLDFNNAVNKIVDLILNITKYNSNNGPSKYNDWIKFTRILQRILGMCFDSSQEIDVGGISKYPEYDDVTDTFFEFTPNEISQIENEISIIRQGYVEFIDCNNVQLPISNVDYVFDTISEVNEDGSNVSTIFQDIYFNLSNDPRWQLQGISLEFPWNQGIIENFVKGAMMSILSPKVLLPFIVMSKAVSTTVSNIDENVINDIEANSPGLMQFAKQYKKMIICATSKIGGLFVEALFLQLKQDILKLVKGIILDLSKTKNEMKINAIRAILDNTERIIKGVVNLVNDYRSCDSLLKSIFN